MRQNNTEPEMRANPSEITNFFWHCLVAARMTDEFKDTTVTKSYRLHAVRKATDCWAGRNGVQYASDAAIAENARSGHWEGCGLTKEHVIPVSVVRKLVHEGLTAPIASEGAVEPLILSDDETQGLTPEVVALFHQHPRAWVVARIIRNWTLHAWITVKEDERFDDKSKHDGISIRQRMPKGWKIGQDRFARYHACGIKVSPI
jgi:hypothetical protein